MGAENVIQTRQPELSSLEIWRRRWSVALLLFFLLLFFFFFFYMAFTVSSS
jgi:hypothetical protein